MRSVAYLGVALLILAGFASAQAVSYHAPKYLIGGYGKTASTMIRPGLYLLDLTGPAPTLTQLVVPDYLVYGFDMDVDNRKILFTCLGKPTTLLGPIRSGLFRYDPATNTLQTIWRAPLSTIRYTNVYHVVVDQNGDYIVNAGQFTVFPSMPTRTFYLWRIDQSGNRTTIATTTKLGRFGFWGMKTAWNVDTGKLLVADGYWGGWPIRAYYPVLEVDPTTGGITTFNIGFVQGWHLRFNLPQNYRNGFLEGPNYRYLYQLQPGWKPLTTLFTLTQPPYFEGGAEFDLQSAARQRLVGATDYTLGNAWVAALVYVDRATGAVTTILHTLGARVGSYDFAFYRGRHTQTVSIGKRRWRILFSAPRFPGRRYAAAMGISGVRPGIRLPSGRRILLNPDLFVYASLYRLLPFFSPGPGKLDANGEAAGKLDFSFLPFLGVPIWIQWVVLDPQAPDGIAYIPDPYVMRI